MSHTPLHILILAAGKGSRMRSDRPKVLHELAGEPLLQHVLETARALRPEAIHVVVGHGAEQVQATFPDAEVNWVRQQRQAGTGHAVAEAMCGVPQQARVLVLYGDTPLCRASDLQALLQAGEGNLAVLGMELDEPTGYGRLLCDGEGLRAIVEEKDADENERAIRRVNTGMMAGPAAVFHQCGQLKPDNVQAEVYLTDLVALERRRGRPVALVMAQQAWTCMGCNTPLELERLERLLQRQRARELMQRGVRLKDATRVEIRGAVESGRDVEMDVGVILQGRCRLGNRVKIGPGCVLSDVEVEDDVEILPYSVLERCRIGAGARIGPFARIRPGTELQPHCRVGNFVELKNAKVGRGSKINHLSYVGDTLMGSQVNVGAGTITCNYDGASKHVTIIGDEAFIGSNAALVAPIEIGRGATIGAGSTLSKDVDPNCLVVERAPARSIPGWKRPKKPRH